MLLGLFCPCCIEVKRLLTVSSMTYLLKPIGADREGDFLPLLPPLNFSAIEKCCIVTPVIDGFPQHISEQMVDWPEMSREQSKLKSKI